MSEPKFRFRIRWSDGEEGVFSVPSLSRREAIQAVSEYVATTGDTGAKWQEEPARARAEGRAS